MEQKHLRDYEARCIQEQPPWCQASCPLHVDARTFLAQAAKGQWAAARKTLERAMPFPGILGRVCDHPCQLACKRREAGGAIEISAIERRCVLEAGPQTKALPIPPKNGRVAVLGAGLAGLTVAHDLAKKAWKVVLFTPADSLGGNLPQYFNESILPREEFATAREQLEKLKTSVTTGQVLDAAFLDAALAEYDAVFVDLDEARGLVDQTPDPLTLSVGRERCFAGGGQEPDGSFSPIRQAADGRRAGSSVDRLLQKVSLTASRELEGPYETSLYTSLADVESAPPVPLGPEGYDAAAAVDEAARCIQCECMECVKACVYLVRSKGYPKTNVRKIYNNLAIVKGTRLANKLINTCMLCGQCSVICPNDFPMAEICLATRETLVQRDIMPPSAHDFALEDLRFNQGEHFRLFRPAPGSDECDYLFFPGCQLAGSDPGLTGRVYAWLRESLDRPVGLGLACCGAPALWAGRRDWFQQTLDDIERERRELGDPVIVTACATCYDVLRRHAPDAPVRAVWEVLAEQEPPPGAAPLDRPLALHDPCTSREYSAILDAVRDVAGKLGQECEELPLSRELTSCCGYGGLLSNVDPALAREVAERRAGESDSPYLAWCAMCRDRLVQVGKPSVHLLDLLFPDSGPYPAQDPSAASDPASARPENRPSPGYSQRHENRARLKRELLRTLWNEEGPAMEAHEQIELLLAPEVQARLEERHILIEDVQRVIQAAEASGRRMKNPAGHFLAAFKPVRVTYWVEYAPEGQAFRVHNAYSHRMDVPGASNGARP